MVPVPLLQQERNKDETRKLRMDKHVFTFYGGAHKSMRGWHNLYENDIENIAGALQQIEAFGGGKMVARILQGPFTSRQLLKVREQVMIHPEYVLTVMSKHVCVWMLTGGMRGGLSVCACSAFTAV
jgi:hypothetical protein